MKKEENTKLPQIDVTDINISFEEIRNEINQISKRMTGLGIEFINKMRGNFISEKNKTFMILRNSIQYRLSSILFHFRLFKKRVTKRGSQKEGQVFHFSIAFKKKVEFTFYKRNMFFVKFTKVC